MKCGACRAVRVFTLLSAFTAAVFTTSVVAAEIDFLRDVQPILAEHCSHCHGPDSGTRQGGLRLDLRDHALAGGESGMPAVIPGDAAASELIRRVSSTDSDLVMPPPAEKKPLTAEKQNVLKQWIAQGAPYAEHWAFVPPVKSPPPTDHAAHPVDAFVLKRLKQEGIAPSPPAAKSAVCRRLYLDLIGLPPSPQDLAEFEQQGLEATVEKLLASPRFGEKWARHWMDAARYSDTNGYEKDLRREQWIWRDWVIDAINRDMPYDQFVVEQIAGDLLPDATQDQIIATGFLRNSMVNEEGAIVPEQFRMVEMFDRIDCIGKSVLGLTTQCAQCHTHKFDPITHDEYFGMFAFLNNSYEATSWIYSEQQLHQIHEVQAQVRRVEERFKAEHPEWQQELAEWEAEILNAQPEWSILTATELGSVSGLNHPTQEPDGSLLMLGHTSSDIYMLSEPDLSGVTGLRLEMLLHGDLPHGGPGRSSKGTWGISELEVLVKLPEQQDWQKLKLARISADFSNAETKSDDGKKSSGPVTFLIDGSDDTTWTADRGIGRRNQPSVAVMAFESPLAYPSGTQLKLVLRMTDMVGCCRFSLTRDSVPESACVDHAALLAMQTPTAHRSAEQQAALFTAWSRQVADSDAYANQIDEAYKSFPEAMTSVLHCRERPEAKQRTTYLLNRGEWDQPLQQIEPHTPEAFHPFPDDLPRNRLGFAKWLTDRRSPLTARVAVNRVWQVMFGRGLVETPEDFGTRSPLPQHRALFDWLAVEFMDNNWSHKHLIRTIVTSDVYQQDSRVTPELLERDPQNVLLARGPRFRADAELVRDIALTVSGLISLKQGGPSVIPPVPQNVLDYNYVYPTYWKPAEGPERYRRAVYLFRKRSMPDPMLSSFDAPNGDFSCAARVRSNTPMAALTGLNETIFVEAARALSLRILRESPPDESARIDYGFLLCTSRRPTEAERQAVLSLLKTQRQQIADGWLNPREIATGEPGQLPDLPENVTPQDAAAWTLAARVLLNLDETISRN